jgi:hypothetical protein
LLLEVLLALLLGLESAKPHVVAPATFLAAKRQTAPVDNHGAMGEAMSPAAPARRVSPRNDSPVHCKSTTCKLQNSEEGDDVFGGRGGVSRASEGQFEGSVSVEGRRDVGRWQFVARNPSARLLLFQAKRNAEKYHEKRLLQLAVTLILSSLPRKFNEYYTHMIPAA